MRIGVIGAGKIGATAARLFVAGDDPQAKGRVSGLIEEIGFAPVDTGSLAEGGRRQQPGAVTSGLQVTAREAQAVLA